MPHILSFTNVLDDEEIASLVSLDEVKVAKQKIDQQQRGSVYFSIQATPTLRAALQETFGLDLAEANSVPMRWIKGDTAAHVDVGPRSFENTYLLYLTDNEGSLLVEGEDYPINKGTAYKFPESLRHETIGTGSEPRLLVGPMSEEGFAVGSFISGPQGSTIYFRQTTDIQYSLDNQVNWINVGNNYPLVIGNSTPSPTEVLKVEFLTDITFNDSSPGGTNKYFLCQSSHIQFGSPSLTQIDAAPLPPRRPIITIDGIAVYPGLIQNGSLGGPGNSNVYVYNLHVQSINGSFIDLGGWVGQELFGKSASNNYIINCSSDGDIESSLGGIVGVNAGSESGATLYVIGCSSSGSIAASAGGIVGSYAGRNGGSVLCKQCWSTGLIQSQGGGIFGGVAGTNTGYAEANMCYSTGTIEYGSGGIYGSDAGSSAGQAIAQKCYSRGSIGEEAGGIYGQYAGSAGGTTSATNCYSAGSIFTSGTGIYGTFKSNGTETNCYAANNSWNSATAAAALQGVGTIWIETTINQPYELNAMGYTPYSITTITNTQELNQTFTQTLQAGQSSVPSIQADASGNSVELLAIQGGDPGSYGTIAIPSTQTGVVTTTSATAPGVYTLIIRSNGSYNITQFELTITGSGPTPQEPTAEDRLCCERPFQVGIKAGYTIRNDTLAGNTLMGARRRGPISSADVLKMKVAQAARRY
jgi:hypothetical protein